jgi:hypothetical protein
MRDVPSPSPGEALGRQGLLADVPPDSTFYEGDDDGRCRVVKPDGERCRAPRIVQYGICAGHSGLGLASDPLSAQERSRKVRARWKARRRLLGIPTTGRATPRQLARLKALQRAEELAEALVEGPLDDPDLTSVQRQLAAVRIVDTAFPLTEVTAEIELPASADEVEAMSWAQMQALAARLFGAEVEGAGEAALLTTGEDDPTGSARM